MVSSPLTLSELHSFLSSLPSVVKEPVRVEMIWGGSSPRLQPLFCQTNLEVQKLTAVTFPLFTISMTGEEPAPVWLCRASAAALSDMSCANKLPVKSAGCRRRAEYECGCSPLTAKNRMSFCGTGSISAGGSSGDCHCDGSMGLVSCHHFLPPDRHVYQSQTCLNAKTWARK